MTNPGTRPDPLTREQGSATVLVLGCVLALCLISGLWVQSARAAIARQHAETAADLAALAGAQSSAAPASGASATTPCAAAAAVAQRNGAALETCFLDASAGIEVKVRVSDPVTAHSRAHAGAVPDP